MVLKSKGSINIGNRHATDMRQTDSHGLTNTLLSHVTKLKYTLIGSQVVNELITNRNAWTEWTNVDALIFIQIDKIKKPNCDIKKCFCKGWMILKNINHDKVQVVHEQNEPMWIQWIYFKLFYLKLWQWHLCTP